MSESEAALQMSTATLKSIVIAPVNKQPVVTEGSWKIATLARNAEMHAEHTVD